LRWKKGGESLLKGERGIVLILSFSEMPALFPNVEIQLLRGFSEQNLVRR
jgi:hypothetical protein